jgi:hypothetical protein
LLSANLQGTDAGQAAERCGARTACSPQHSESLRLVLALTSLILAGHRNAGGQVHNAHGRVCGVDVLPALAAGPAGLYAQVSLCYLHLNLHRMKAGEAVRGAEYTTLDFEVRLLHQEAAGAGDQRCIMYR